MISILSRSRIIQHHMSMSQNATDVMDFHTINEPIEPTKWIYYCKHEGAQGSRPRATCNIIG